MQSHVLTTFILPYINFLPQEYSVRTTQLALCQVVCDQLSIPQVSTFPLERKFESEKILNYVSL